MKKTILTATLWLALTFTLGCGEHSLEEILFGESSSSVSQSSSSQISSSSGSSSSLSSSSSRASSSSARLSSSSVVGPISCVDGTVQIGNQCWQKSNSNIETSVGKSRCYENNPANCDIYGRLYDWEAAKSACPSGFRLPTIKEWADLFAYIEGDKGCTRCAAWHLKTSEWGGLDSYGFSAMPGGRYLHGFEAVGNYGDWWSASENTTRTASYYYISNSDEATRGYQDKEGVLYSVRCLQDENNGVIGSSSSLKASSSSAKLSSSSVGVVYGPSVTHNGETYKTVVIGTQTWFQRNLNYAAEGSMCYKYDPANCDIYGRLYDWKTAKLACPKGFHLPTIEEWDVLIAFVKKDKGCDYCDARHLKATDGWKNNLHNFDSYGFSALPGGCYGCSDLSSGGFNIEGLGYYGNWWSSIEGIGVFGHPDARFKFMENSSNYAGQSYCGASDVSSISVSGNVSLLSVRCIKD